jgi:hypothetical protein
VSLRDDFQLSHNRKTGYSINLDHKSCRPTKACKLYCYGRALSAEEAKKHGLHANRGPITWPTQQAAYARNREWLEAATTEEIWSKAKEHADFLKRMEYNNLRLCGMGDLTAELVEYAVALSSCGVRPWGFTKRHEMLHLMKSRLSLNGITSTSQSYPKILGSTDSSMSQKRVQCLLSATADLGGRPALAYITMEPGFIGAAEINGLWFRDHIVVTFGYHSNSHKTTVYHKLACPATNGQETSCQTCRRCINHSQSKRSSAEQPRRSSSAISL